MFTEHVISTNALGAFNAYSIDVDGDGDNDIISASGADNKIAWYENILEGCMDEESCNYNPNAESDDGSCIMLGQIYGSGDVNGDNSIDVLDINFILLTNSDSVFFVMSDIIQSPSELQNNLHYLEVNF